MFIHRCGGALATVTVKNNTNRMQKQRLDAVKDAHSVLQAASDAFEVRVVQVEAFSETGCGAKISLPRGTREHLA
jgi:predicted membrane-bound spermidine synthase